MLHGSFMSTPYTIVIPAGKTNFAIQLIIEPLIKRIMATKVNAVISVRLAGSVCQLRIPCSGGRRSLRFSGHPLGCHQIQSLPVTGAGSFMFSLLLKQGCEFPAGDGVRHYLQALLKVAPCLPPQLIFFAQAPQCQQQVRILGVAAQTALGE